MAVTLVTDVAARIIVIIAILHITRTVTVTMAMNMYLITAVMMSIMTTIMITIAIASADMSRITITIMAMIMMMATTRVVAMMLARIRNEHYFGTVTSSQVPGLSAVKSRTVSTLALITIMLRLLVS